MASAAAIAASRSGATTDAAAGTRKSRNRARPSVSDSGPQPARRRRHRAATPAAGAAGGVAATRARKSRLDNAWRTAKEGVLHAVDRWHPGIQQALGSGRVAGARETVHHQQRLAVGGRRRLGDVAEFGNIGEVVARLEFEQADGGAGSSIR